MIREIVQIGAPVLREKCAPVKEFDEALWTLLDDMKETLKNAEGAGLAAPQVGVPIRAVQVDVEEGFLSSSTPSLYRRRASRQAPKAVFPSAERQAPSPAPTK